MSRLYRPYLIGRFLHRTLPQACGQLLHWQALASRCPEPALRQQALASLEGKRFHAQCASVYGRLAPAYHQDVVALTVAMQTISDYLDNLCDRTGVHHEPAFRTLHTAMVSTLSPPGTAHADFYGHFPGSDDGGYLRALVAKCQHHASRLPALPVVRDRAVQLLELYADLQVLKHLHPQERMSRLRAWHARRGRDHPQLAWHEFGAACGSTLGIFALLAAAARPDLDEEAAEAIQQAYFPAVCGLHILLDYFIDQGEDARHGDLNFCRLYSSPQQCARRLSWFIGEALKGAATLPEARFHLTVVQGLVAVYLSDPKSSGLWETSRELLETAGPGTRAIYRLCRLLRRLRVLASG